MWRWNQRFVCILLIWLVVQISACNAGSSPVATLIPTAAWPAPQVNPGQRPDNDTGQIPPTWTHTPPPRFALTPALSPPTPTPYQRTATPTAPTRTPTSTATPSDTPVPSVTSTPTATPTPWPTIAMDEVWSLDRYPRPFSDNGWGMHWFSTYEQDVQTIDRFVVELQRMHIRWLVFLNDGTDIDRNDYLVQRLVRAGIVPVMRLYTHGIVPYGPDLGAAVRHYRGLGVYYFQLYNEPNLYAEGAGREPNPDWYAANWAPAARVVIASGGLPGFGSLSPGGEYDDLAYFRGALQALKRRRQDHLLNQGWISVHNYANYQPVDSTKGFLRFRLYDQIVVEELGRSLPILGTEAGHYGDIGEQFRHVSAEYRYLSQREEYFFCHTYWLLGNEIGGSWDSSFEYQALFRVDGYINPLVWGLFYRGPR